MVVPDGGPTVGLGSGDGEWEGGGAPAGEVEGGVRGLRPGTEAKASGGRGLGVQTGGGRWLTAVEAGGVGAIGWGGAWL